LIAFVMYPTIKGKKFNYTALIIFTLFNLVLVLQFIPFGEVLYADRYMYIPLIGLAWLLGFVIDQLKLSTRIVFPILIVLLSISSFSRSKVWKSGITLYEDILHNFPNSFVALNSIGVEYMLRDNNSKALYYLNKSIQVAPYNYKGFYNRGLFYLKNQKPREAIKNFDQSLSIYEYSKSYVGRASAYHLLGDLPNAIKDAQASLRIEKNNSKAHFVLGNCFNEQNKLEDALSEYNKSIALNDGEAEFYFKRAIVFGKKQEFEKCINDIDLCLAFDPIYYEAYYWRGVAKVNLGRNGCSDFEIAARQNFEPASTAFKKYCR
jgi:protein O-mannosyl-transferase